jgi:hypothetical protein
MRSYTDIGHEIYVGSRLRMISSGKVVDSKSRFLNTQGLKSMKRRKEKLDSKIPESELTVWRNPVPTSR